MKQISFTICAVSLLFIGCTEKGPLVDFGNTVSIDTTYLVSPVPSPQPHNVIVEEFTGQSCSNCPAGHADLVNYEAAHPGRLNIISLYQTDGSALTKPPAGSVHDFRDSLAKIIGDVIYGGGVALPIAGVDRVPGSTGLLLNRGEWGTAITARLSVVDSINLNLSSTYDSVSQTATITVIVTYTQLVKSKQNLTVVIVEDSMIDKQELPFGQTDDEYVFTNVFRAMISLAPLGDPILDVMTEKEPGRTYKKTYTYVPKSITPAINPKHCRVIAFINSAKDNDYHIWQSTQTKLSL